MVQLFSYNTLIIISFFAIFIMLVAGVAVMKKPEKESTKKAFFLLLMIPIVLGTVYIAGETFFKIFSSPTKGPVHWHADYKIVYCGEELDLSDPHGFTNRVGSEVVHEHGDNRIHIEGIMESESEGSLRGFIKEIGGFLSNEELKFPIHDGVIEMRNGDTCPNGSNGQLQLFVWKTQDNVTYQEKINNISSYILSPFDRIPPGDCVILEFGESKEKTELICDQYEIAERRGDITIQR